MVEISVERPVLEANEKLAAEYRRRYDDAGVCVVNMMSSPGAGKTTLLERTLERIAPKIRVAVIEGDIATSEDAERIADKGVMAVQINTDGTCHLDGVMIGPALDALDLDDLDLLVIENVGNLVCPVEFNLGEHLRLAVLSVTEGHDKPVKYPALFRESQALVINKIDLLPYVDCDLDRIRRDVTAINPDLKIFELSCRSGEGLDGWYDWLLGEIDRWPRR
jgi:hydrogenase nickel incorporation protein HypB